MMGTHFFTVSQNNVVAVIFQSINLSPIWILMVLKKMIERNVRIDKILYVQSAFILRDDGAPPASAVIFFNKNKELTNQMRKTTSQVSTLISKTMFFCQEKNKPVYVMWQRNEISFRFQ
jgi:hypothetical protein